MTSSTAVKRIRRKRTGAFHHGDLAEQVVRAAEDVVEKRGHHALTMMELARRLGVTDAALYRHYESRDALLAEVTLRGFAGFLDALERALAAHEAAGPAVLACGRAYVRFCAAHPGWFRLHFSRTWSEELAKRPDVAARIGAPGLRVHAMLNDRLAALAPHDEGRVADLFRLVWGSIHGLAVLVVERVFQLAQSDEERLTAADAALELLVDSLHARARAARAAL